MQKNQSKHQVSKLKWGGVGWEQGGISENEAVAKTAGTKKPIIKDKSQKTQKHGQ